MAEAGRLRAAQVPGSGVAIRNSVTAWQVLSAVFVTFKYRPEMVDKLSQGLRSMREEHLTVSRLVHVMG